MRFKVLFSSLLTATLLFSFGTVMGASLEKIEKKVEDLAAELAELKGDAIDDVKPLDVDLSGSVNMGILLLNDGRSTGDEQEVFIVDNDNASTRLRVDAAGDYGDDLSVGATIEVQFEINSTADITQNQSALAGSNNFTRRILEVFFESAKYGKASIGHGKTASDGSAEEDFSETSLGNCSIVDGVAGGVYFRDKNGKALVTSFQLKDAFMNLDGLSRDMRVRYDTPEFYGYTLSASVLDGGDWDAALRYSDDLKDVSIGAAIAYAHARQIDNFQQVSASIAALHNPSGFNIAFATASKQLTGSAANVARNNLNYYYVKLGLLKEWFSYGKTALALDYYKGQEIYVNDDSSMTYSAAIVQSVDKIHTQFYFTGRNHSYKDATSTEYQELWAFLAGARVVF